MIFIFTLEELIYIVKTIYVEKDLEEYTFKKTIDEKLKKMNFKLYLEFIEKCEDIAFKLTPSLELNSLNFLHMEIKKQSLKYLLEFLE